tara:strand:- start:2498 stop:2605 length:108 start_codon:yes stop_codon:yes gene_type:complete
MAPIRTKTVIRFAFTTRIMVNEVLKSGITLARVLI